MVKKIAFHFAWSFCIVWACLTSFPIVAASIADSFRTGQLVSFTPFDARMRSAGLFSAGLGAFTPTNQSMEDLFNTAKSFRYVPDRGSDHWQSAEETNRRRSGDCEDKAIWLFKRLAASRAYNARLVIGRYRPLDTQLHVWVMCTDRNGEICILDPAKQRRVWRAGAMDSGFYQPLYGYDGRNRYKYFRAN